MPYSYVYANNVNTTLAAPLTSTSTTITLSSAANLPTVSAGQTFALTLNDVATGNVFEICYVTAISGASLTVVRGQENTTAVAWNAGDRAYGPVTAGELTQLGNVSFSGPLILTQNGLPCSDVGIENDLAATNGMVLNVPSGSTYGYRFNVNCATVAEISNTGVGTFYGMSVGAGNATIAGSSTTAAGLTVSQGVAYFDGGTAVALSSGFSGYLQIAAGTEQNLVIDQANVQSRSNGTAATLNLNPLGGSVTFSSSGMLGAGVNNGIDFTANPYAYVLSSPACTLHYGRTDLSVGGVSAGTMDFYSGSVGTLLALDTSGNCGVAGSYYSASKRELKEHIETLSGEDALEIVARTPIWRYAYKAEAADAAVHIGIMAEESHPDVNAGGQAMDLGSMVSVAFAAIQELRGKIDALTA